MTALALLILLPVLLVVLPFCVLVGIWEAASGRPVWPRLRVNGPTRISGLSKLGVAASIVAVPFLATPTVESWNGWVDEDHDGMLDGFSNGSYDWVDVNGPALIGVWAAAAALIVLTAGTLGWRITRRSEVEIP